MVQVPPSDERPVVGQKVKIKTDNLIDFGQDPTKDGPLQGRLRVESVEELTLRAEDGSLYECTLKASDEKVVTARNRQFTIVVRTLSG